VREREERETAIERWRKGREKPIVGNW